MYEQVGKPKESQSGEAANSGVQKKSDVKQGFGFVDNRPEGPIQLRLNTLVNYKQNEKKTIPKEASAGRSFDAQNQSFQGGLGASGVNQRKSLDNNIIQRKDGKKQASRHSRNRTYILLLTGLGVPDQDAVDILNSKNAEDPHNLPELARVYHAIKANKEDTTKWIDNGCKFSSRQLPAATTHPGTSRTSLGLKTPSLAKGGTDQADWNVYEQSYTDLTAKRAAMNAVVNGANDCVRNVIDPDIALAMGRFRVDRALRDQLTKADIQPEKDKMVRLDYYASFYGAVNKLNGLTHINRYNTPTHAKSFGSLFGTWKGNALAAAGKADFDLMYRAIQNVHGNRSKAKGDATKNPTIRKGSLLADEEAVLDGVKNRLGGMPNKGRFGRGGHHTDPTTAHPTKAGSLGQEYNATPDPTAVAKFGAVGTLPWQAKVKQIPSLGPKRFVSYNGDWFYSPTHYLPTGSTSAYKLIIDA